MNGLLNLLIASHRSGRVHVLQREHGRRILWGLIISLSLHLLIFNLLLFEPGDKIKGETSNTAEGGEVAGSSDMLAIDLTAMSPRPKRSVLASQVEPVLVPKDDQSLTPPQTVGLKPTSGSDLASDGTKNVPTLQDKQALLSSEDSQVLSQAAPAANGSRDGSETLLDEIARCLPAGVKPALTHAKLDIQLDKDGQLATVPHIELDLSKSSNDQIVQANLIVQAALQCGPYVLPKAPTELLSLTPDFTSTKPN